MTCAWSAWMADARVLDQAFADVCAQRRNTPPEDDIWSLRRTWTVVRSKLKLGPRTLRKAMRCANQHFAAAGLRQHP